MSVETIGIWAIICALLVVVGLLANEIGYRVQRRYEHRTLDKSALWKIKKRRGQVR